MALAEAKAKPLKARGVLRVGVVIAYLAGREKLCAQNLYPRSHLWGADAMREAGWEVEYLRPERRMATRFGGRLGNRDFDLHVRRKANEFDVIYVADGRLPMTQLARRMGRIRAKLIQWEYVAPRPGAWWRLREVWHRKFLARGIDGYACLTETAAAAFRELNPRAQARAIQWAPDTTMFPGSEKDGEYLLACGRTNRDYATLVKAAAKVDFPVVLLVSPGLVSGMAIPPNVRFVEGPKDGGTDKGIPYSELIHEWYANARAVLIPRLDLAWDTSGLTNLLEAMAMYRPVLMTRTGRLDLDIEQAGVGMFVAPGDAQDWATKITRIWNDARLREPMRARAKEQVRTFYNLRRFGNDVVEFVRAVAELK
jgi:glycosyltransferase involved in cell wall biosynthesis